MANAGYSHAVYVESKQEPTFDFSCTLCEKEGKRTEASKYCTECFVYMCDACVQNKHDQFPLNTTHQMLDKDQLPTNSLPMLKSFPTTRCKKHPGELINIFCGNHNVVCCSVCKAIDHGDCTKTQHLPEAAEGIQSSGEYLALIEEVKQVITDVDKILSNLEDEKSRIAKDRQHVEQIIADFRERVNLHLDDLEKKTLSQLKKIEKRMAAEIDEKRLYIEHIRQESQRVLDQLNSFKGDNECELFVQVKVGNTVINIVAQELINVPKTGPTAHIQFEIDSKIENYIKSWTKLGSFLETSLPASQGPRAKTNVNQSVNLSPRRVTSTRLPTVTSSNTVELASPRFPSVKSGKTLESATRLSSLKSGKTVVSSSPRQTALRINSGSFAKYKTQLFGKFHVKEKSDARVCSISDICQLPDGNLVITDYNNKKLKRLLVTSYKLLDFIQLPGQPMGVCNTGPGQVAVSLFEEKKIQLVSVENILVLAREIRVGSYCRGIVCINDTLLVCCGGKFNSQLGIIKVYDNDGQLRQSIPHIPQRLSSVPRYMTVIDDGQHLLMSSLGSYSIAMINLTGNLIETFSDVDLKEPVGISTDGKGQVFVCGNYGNKVIQLSPKHQKMEVILKEEDGIIKPQAVCFDGERSRLMVSCSDSNEILVFKVPQEKKRTNRK